MFLSNKPAANKTAKPTHAQKTAIPSILSKDMHILGNIVHDEGVVDFDGTLEGNIRCGMLTLRPNASVKGEIIANNVFVYGRMDGLIKAKNVHFYAGCHVEGIVMHESLSIEDGAFVDAKFKRSDKLQPVSQILDEEYDAEESPVKMLENIRLIR